jgi:hypothetical protein
VSAGIVLSPALAVCCGLAVTAALALLLSPVLVWFRYQALERHLLRRQEEAEKVAESLRQAVGQLAKDVDDLAQHSAPVAPAEPRRGLNLSKRSHALRMHRRGESVEQIAATLGVTRQEIDLLLKVHQILVASV